MVLVIVLITAATQRRLAIRSKDVNDPIGPRSANRLMDDLETSPTLQIKEKEVRIAGSGVS
jgi:hypothetical protein